MRTALAAFGLGKMMGGSGWHENKVVRGRTRHYFCERFSEQSYLQYW